VRSKEELTLFMNWLLQKSNIFIFSP